MDPAIIVFGFGVGFLVGITGMGGGSLMTPLLILVFGIKPMTAIGTDIFYAAITKMVGAWRHLKLKTVKLDLVFWMALGSVPAAIAGVWVIEILKDRYGDDLDEDIFAILAAALLVVGVATLVRGFFLADKIQERDDFEMLFRHKVAAVAGRVHDRLHHRRELGGLGTLIGVMLIALYRLSPRRVVGTDIVHAAILLTAAAVAHMIGGNVDYGLAGNILVGSIPGIWVGSNMSVRVPQGVLRTVLGLVLVAAGVTIMNKANTVLVPYAIAAAAVLTIGLFAAQIYLPRRVSPRFLAAAGKS